MYRIVCPLFVCMPETSTQNQKSGKPSNKSNASTKRKKAASGKPKKRTAAVGPHPVTTFVTGPSVVGYKVSKNGGRPFRINHSEMCFNVQATLEPDKIAAYAINPANGTLFPYLSGIAAKFDAYKFLSLTFRYVPEVPTSTTGHIAMAVDPDPDAGYDDLPHSRQEMMAFETCVSASLWTSVALKLPLTIINRYPKYLVATQDVERETGDPVRDIGRLFIESYSATTGFVGTLWADYAVELFSPGVNRVPLQSMWTEAEAGTSGVADIPMASNINYYVPLTDMCPYNEKSLYATANALASSWTLWGDKFSVGMAVVGTMWRYGSTFGEALRYVKGTVGRPSSIGGPTAGVLAPHFDSACQMTAPMTNYDLPGFAFSRAGRYRISLKIVVASPAAETFNSWTVAFYPSTASSGGAMSATWQSWVKLVYDSPGVGTTTANAIKSMSVSDRIVVSTVTYCTLCKDIEIEVLRTGPDIVWTPGVQVSFVTSASGNYHMLGKTTASDNLTSHFTITYLGDSSDD